MSKFRIQGQVLAANLAPVAGASVKIIDKDEDGRDDVILTRTTNDRGNFSGMSTEWQDTRKTPLVDLPPWTDTKVLAFEVRKGGRAHSGPFMHVDDTTSVPIIVPWLETPVLLAKVNGIACDSPDDIIAEVMRAARRGDRINLEVLDPVTVTALGILTEGRQETLDWLESRNPSLGQTMRGLQVPTATIAVVEPVSDTVLIILACAVLAVAIGASLVLVSVAVSLILATAMGYCDIGVDQDTEVSPDGRTQNTIKFGLTKC
jgi:hypothetical protein